MSTPTSPRLQPVPPPPRGLHRYESPGYRAKRLLLGAPFKTSQLSHARISKRVALAVFSSDPISSTAYATEEMLLVLITAGAAASGLALPVAGGIALLLLLLVVSYRQVIRAYPRGGGAYMVSRDNLGSLFASICGAALLIDYVLTVAVSVSAGTAAIASAVEALAPWRVELSVGFIVLLAWGNLRGIKEAGRLFAVPTYVYILSLGGVVVWGAFRVASGSASPMAADPAATSTSRISSVAYAVEEIGSEEKTASATRLEIRSLASWEVVRAGPSRIRLARYRGDW